MRRLLAGALCLVICLGLFGANALAAVVLSVGSRGENVTKVQKRLIQYDYLDGTADGIYGEETAAALGVTLSASGSTSASSSTAIISSDHRLLSKLVYAEARGEPYKGMVAVAAVVLNRVRSSSFPNTISGVIYQKGAFSCVSNGSINNTPNNQSIRAALDALNGWDPTGGCLYYYNPKLTDDEWIRTRTVQTVIGNHYFAR